ncbi:MAG TPA: adenylosuccinate synthase [Microscillaceae bacterium]|nr:adenylosuccinate synthase [Microscillaceae bacterium]
MSVHVLLGLQWGDEGKGKIVDYLAPQYPVVARFQGGPNAGHTLEFEGIKHVLHQIPSGIFRPDTQNIIGNGVVLDAIVLKKEIEALAQYHINVKQNLFISRKAHLILPTHRLLDQAWEEAKGVNKIGSTLRGIGPTYQDKIGRQGLRVGDLQSDNWKQAYNEIKRKHLDTLRFLGKEVDLTQVEADFFEAVNYLLTLNLVDSEYMLNDALQAGKPILAEGAQGALLDIDFGSYPFVTSSNTLATGACTGLGISPKHISQVFGIFKAYCTRVGSGPFPTEQDNAIGEEIRAIGREFGATTGRKRRCGWLDLPALKYAAMLNGTTHLLMMKGDVLNDFAEIQVCTHYRLPDGSLTDRMPFDLNLTQVEPVYQTFKGWQRSLVGIQKFEQLPSELLAYIQFIEESLHIPVSLVSTSPDRSATLLREATVLA